MDVRRILRVSEAVKEELYEIIGFELEDPRLVEVEVTDVQVSPDSRHAAIKVALRGDQRRRNHALAALEHASGYLRQELASRLQLRHVPELHFEQDKNPDVESRVDFLLRRPHAVLGAEMTDTQAIAVDLQAADTHRVAVSHPQRVVRGLGQIRDVVVQ